MDRRYRDQDWLKQQYGELGLTQREIGELCGVSASTIRRWMAEFDIETRDVVGENHGIHGKERPDEVREKISNTLRGRAISDSTRQRMSEAHRGRPTPKAVRDKISEALTGMTRPPETREKMSVSTAGEQNPNWRGGYSRRYGAGWSPARDAVRERDQICQHCGADGTDRRLEVHHLVPVRPFRESPELSLSDAHDLDNLVLLCSRCHGKADHGLIDLV